MRKRSLPCAGAAGTDGARYAWVIPCVSTYFAPAQLHLSRPTSDESLICVAQEASNLPPGPSNPAQDKGLKHKLTTAETMEIGEAYGKVLLAKSRLFKLLGSKPLGQVDEKGFDLTAGGTALSGKYNQYVAQTTIRSNAGDFYTPTQEQETKYRNLARELKEKGVLAELDNISNAQVALSSKVDAISKNGGQITSLRSIYSSYKKRAIKQKRRE